MFTLSALALNLGFYSGYSGATSKISNFSITTQTPPLIPVRNGNVHNTSHCWHHSALIGANHTYKNIKFSLNGFAALTSFNHILFKGPLSIGGEISALYKINQFSFGPVGGFELASFGTQRYEVEFPSEKNALISSTEESTTYPQGFLGAKLAWSPTASWTIGLKGTYTFNPSNASKDITHNKWHFQKSIEGTISQDINTPFDFKTHDTYGTFKILLGIEYSAYKMNDRFIWNSVGNVIVASAK